MKKRLLIGLFTILLAFSMTGCANVMPNLTEEQMDAVGEYAAILMIKYDANNRIRLRDREEVEAADRKKERLEALLQAQLEAEQEKNPQIEDNSNKDEESKPDKPTQIKYDNLEDFITLPQGVTIRYTGARTSTSYPDFEDDELLALEATPGKRLLILGFTLTNQSGENQTVDIWGLNASYKIAANQSFKKGILNTFLLTDLATFKGNIPVGASQNLVLITEYDPVENADIDTGIESVVLTLKNTVKTCTVKLQ